jgi:hypothetical protein
MSARTNTSSLTDAPLTRNSLVVLQGDENDLLSESPVFQKAKVMEQPASDIMRSSRSLIEPMVVPEEPLDE